MGPSTSWEGLDPQGMAQYFGAPEYRNREEKKYTYYVHEKHQQTGI